MTDIYDYLRVLFVTSGQAHCPYCQAEVPTLKATQMAEHMLALPKGSVVEIRRAGVQSCMARTTRICLGQMRTQGLPAHADE